MTMKMKTKNEMSDDMSAADERVKRTNDQMNCVSGWIDTQFILCYLSMISTAFVVNVRA